VPLARSRLGILYGLAAALLFGVSTPVAKRLLDSTTPHVLAGLLYLGAFLALAATTPLRRRSAEAPLTAQDLPRLAGLVAAGGVAAPVLLLIGLERVSGAAGSLLLNLEGPFTLLLGVLVFGEHLRRRAGVAAVAVFAGAAVLTVEPGGGGSDATGTLCIAAACVLWAIDNNLTRSLTTRDPFAVARIKAGVAAATNLSLAAAIGADAPTTSVVAIALVVGALSYGASIVLDAYALRTLGAAREAVLFATAPFVGAVLAVPVLSETLGGRELLAGAAMAAGVSFVINERHDHLHTHEPMTHEHVHVHDEHHRHRHDSEPVFEPHSHMHAHERLSHAHSHVSDVHHRHAHRRRPRA